MNGSHRFTNIHGPVNVGSGNQNAGDGIQIVAGRDVRGTVSRDPQVAAAITSLRREVGSLRLSTSEHAMVARHVEALAAAPDKATAGRVLDDLAEGLREAGALRSGAETVVDAIRTLARWLGRTAGVAALL